MHKANSACHSGSDTFALQPLSPLDHGHDIIIAQALNNAPRMNSRLSGFSGKHWCRHLKMAAAGMAVTVLRTQIFRSDVDKLKSSLPFASF